MLVYQRVCLLQVHVCLKFLAATATFQQFLHPFTINLIDPIPLKKKLYGLNLSVKSVNPKKKTRFKGLLFLQTTRPPLLTHLPHPPPERFLRRAARAAELSATLRGRLEGLPDSWLVGFFGGKTDRKYRSFFGC